MSAPLPPYSTFRTDNKVRPTAAGPAGGIGSGRRPEKGRVPRTVRPSVLRGCTEDTSVRKVVRRRPSRAFSGPPTGGTRGRSFELNCHPFRSAVSNFQFPLFSLRHPSSFSLRHPPGPPNHRWSTFRPFPTLYWPDFQPWPLAWHRSGTSIDGCCLGIRNGRPQFLTVYRPIKRTNSSFRRCIRSHFFSSTPRRDPNGTPRTTTCNCTVGPVLPPFRLGSLGSARLGHPIYMAVGKWIEINSFHSPPPACRCHVAIHT